MNLGLLMEETLSTGQMEEWFPYLEEKIQAGEKIKLCYLCQTSYVDTDAYDEHHTSMLHNINLHKRHKKGGLRKHSCQLCLFECTGIVQFAKHLKSKKHTVKLNGLRKWKKRTLGRGYTEPDSEDVDSLLTPDLIESVNLQEKEAERILAEKKRKQEALEKLPPKKEDSIHPLPPAAPSLTPLRSILKRGKAALDREVSPAKSSQASDSGSVHGRREPSPPIRIPRGPLSIPLPPTSPPDRGRYNQDDRSRIDRLKEAPRSSENNSKASLDDSRTNRKQNFDSYRYGNSRDVATSHIDFERYDGKRDYQDKKVDCLSEKRDFLDDRKKYSSNNDRMFGYGGDVPRTREVYERGMSFMAADVQLERSRRLREEQPKTSEDYDRVLKFEEGWNKRDNWRDTKGPSYKEGDTNSRLDPARDAATEMFIRQLDSHYSSVDESRRLDYDRETYKAPDTSLASGTYNRGQQSPQRFYELSPDKQNLERNLSSKRGDSWSGAKDSYSRQYNPDRRYSEEKKKDATDSRSFKKIPGISGDKYSYSGVEKMRDIVDPFKEPEKERLLDPFARSPSPVTGLDDGAFSSYKRPLDAVAQLQRRERIGPHTPDSEIDYNSRSAVQSPDTAGRFSPIRDTQFQRYSKPTSSLDVGDYEIGGPVEPSPVSQRSANFDPTNRYDKDKDSRRGGLQSPAILGADGSLRNDSSRMSTFPSDASKEVWVGGGESPPKSVADSQSEENFVNNLQGTGLKPAPVDVDALLKNIMGLGYNTLASTPSTQTDSPSQTQHKPIVEKESVTSSPAPVINMDVPVVEDFGDLDERQRNKPLAPKIARPPMTPPEVCEAPAYMSNICPKPSLIQKTILNPLLDTPLGVRPPLLPAPVIPNHMSGTPVGMPDTPSPIGPMTPASPAPVTPTISTPTQMPIQVLSQSTGTTPTQLPIEVLTHATDTAPRPPLLPTPTLTQPTQFKPENPPLKGISAELYRSEKVNITVKTTDFIDSLLGKTSTNTTDPSASSKETTASSLAEKKKQGEAFSYAKWKEMKRAEEERKARERAEHIRRIAEENLKKKEMEKKAQNRPTPPDKYEPRPRSKQPLSFNSKPSERTTSSVGRSYNDQHRGPRPDKYSQSRYGSKPHTSQSHHDRYRIDNRSQKPSAPKAPSVDTAELLIKKTEILVKEKHQSSSSSKKSHDERHKKRSDDSRSTESRKSSHSHSSECSDRSKKSEERRSEEKKSEERKREKRSEGKSEEKDQVENKPETDSNEIKKTSDDTTHSKRSRHASLAQLPKQVTDKSNVKEKLKQLINAPRSRKQQLQLDQLIKNYKQSIAPRSRKLSAQSSQDESENDPKRTGELNVEELPENLQMEIAALLEIEEKENEEDEGSKALIFSEDDDDDNGGFGMLDLPSVGELSDDAEENEKPTEKEEKSKEQDKKSESNKHSEHKNQHKHKHKRHKHPSSHKDSRQRKESGFDLESGQESDIETVDVSCIIEKLGLDDFYKTGQNVTGDLKDSMVIFTHNDEFLHVSEEEVRKYMVKNSEDVVLFREVQVDLAKKFDNVTDLLKPSEVPLTINQPQVFVKQEIKEEPKDKEEQMDWSSSTPVKAEKPESTDSKSGDKLDDSKQDVGKVTVDKTKLDNESTVTKTEEKTDGASEKVEKLQNASADNDASLKDIHEKMVVEKDAQTTNELTLKKEDGAVQSKGPASTQDEKADENQKDSKQKESDTEFKDNGSQKKGDSETSRRVSVDGAKAVALLEEYLAENISPIKKNADNQEKEGGTTEKPEKAEVIKENEKGEENDKEMKKDSETKAGSMETEEAKQDQAEKPQAVDEADLIKTQLMCGNGTVYTVLALSLHEEEVKKKIVKTDSTIAKLEAMIKSTQEQLAARHQTRAKLMKEEEKIRTARLKILEDASKAKGKTRKSHSNETYLWDQVKSIRLPNLQSEVASAPMNIRYMGSIKADDFNSDLLSKLYSNLEYTKDGQVKDPSNKFTKTFAKKLPPSSSDSSDSDEAPPKKPRRGRPPKHKRASSDGDSESSSSRVKSYTKKHHPQRSKNTSDSEGEEESTMNSKRHSKAEPSKTPKEPVVKRKPGRPPKKPREETPSRSRVDIKANPISRSGIMDITMDSGSSTRRPTNSSKKSVKSSARVETDSSSDENEKKMFTDSNSDNEMLRIDLKGRIFSSSEKKRGPGRPPRKPKVSESDSDMSVSGSSVSKTRNKKRRRESDHSELPVTAPKKRGRPPKKQLDLDDTQNKKQRRGRSKNIKTINLKTLTSAERRKMQPKVVIKRLTKNQLRLYGCSLKSTKKKTNSTRKPRRQKKRSTRSDDDEMPSIFDHSSFVSRTDDQSSIGPSASQIGRSDWDDFSEADLSINIKREIMDSDNAEPEMPSIYNNEKALIERAKMDVSRVVIKNEPMDTGYYKHEFGVDGGSIVDSMSDGVVGVDGTVAAAVPAIRRFDGHTAAIHELYVWRGYLFTASEDHTARRFNLQTSDCLTVYTGHEKGVQSVLVAESSEAKPLVFTASFDNYVYGFSLEEAKIKVQHKFEHRVFCLHENWGNLYAGLGNGTVAYINIKENIVDEMFKCSEAAIKNIETGREGATKLLIVASNDCTISIRNAETSLLIRTIEGHTKSPMGMKLVGEYLYSCGADKTLQIHDLHTSDLKKTVNYKGVITSLSVTGDRVLTAGYEGFIRCLNKKTYSVEQLYYGPENGMITSMVVSGNQVVSGTREGLIETIVMDPESKWSCQFGRCNLVFGLRAHLEHHIITDHIQADQASQRCLWKDCTDHLSTTNQDTKVDDVWTEQEAIAHIAKHLEREAQRFEEAVRAKELSSDGMGGGKGEDPPPLVIANVVSMSGGDSEVGDKA